MYLPKIPNDLIDLEKINNLITVNDIGYGNIHKKYGSILTPCRYQYGDVGDQKLIDWIRDNICSKQLRVLYQFQTNVSNLHSTHIVHSDINRIKALNYIIETGGSNATLSWYKEKDKPLKRSKKQGGGQSDTGYVKYDDLELLESVYLEKNSWALIDTDILHDVDRVESKRISLSISFLYINDIERIKNL